MQFVLFPCRSIPRRVPVQAPSIPDPPVWTLRSLRAHTAASTLRTGRDVSNVDCVLFLFGFLCVSNWLSYPTDDCYEVVRPKCLGLHSHDHQPHALRNMMTAPTYGNGCHVYLFLLSSSVSCTRCCSAYLPSGFRFVCFCVAVISWTFRPSTPLFLTFTERTLGLLVGESLGTCTQPRS